MTQLDTKSETLSIDDYFNEEFDFSILDAMPKIVFNSFVADRSMLYYNAYGNFTACECPVFNKPNWLVYLMMYTQILDPPET
jgi:hypothetical protein